MHMRLIISCELIGYNGLHCCLLFAVITRGKRYRADIQDNPAYETTRSSSALLDEASPTPSSGIHNLRQTLPSQDALSTATFQTELSTLDSSGTTEASANRQRAGQTTSGSTFDETDSRDKEQLPFEDVDGRNLDHTYEMIQSIGFASK